LTFCLGGAKTFISSEQNNADKMVLGIPVVLPPFFFVGNQLFEQKSVSARRPDVYVLNDNIMRTKEKEVLRPYSSRLPFLVCVSKSFVSLRF
jgi:hypothetical protein